MKWILRLLMLLFLVVPVAAVTVSYVKAYSNPYGKADLSALAVPNFEKVEFPFNHKYDKDNSLPFLGAAIVDIDGDDVPEVFVGGGYEQADMVLEFDGEGFADATATKGKGLTKDNFNTTFGAAVIDTDADGRSDLFVARDDGITLYLNKKDGFQAKKLDIPFNEKSTPLSITLADLNHDGHADMFVSTYIKLHKVEGENIFNKEGYGSSSLLLINNGDNSFTDITEKAGMAYVHNTFVGVFSDVDRDGDQDLVVAYDTGQVRTWRNNGDLTFTSSANPTSDRYGYPMGLGIGDYNNDGRMDFVFSNVSSTPPRFLAKGDLRDDQIFHTPLWLFRNDGEFAFTDVAQDTKVANYEFSWGMVFEDLNNDGREDIIVAQNYVSLPVNKIFRLPGRLLMQLPDGTFGTAEDAAGVVNRNFEITPLMADFDNDGYRDMIRINLAGPSHAFISKGGSNGFVKVRLADTPRSLGALVEVALPGGERLTQQFTSGEGLCSDQSHELTFGLGDAKSVESVTVFYPDGTTKEFDPPAVGQTLRVP